MATIKDVHETLQVADRKIRIFGAPAVFRNAISEKLQNVGQAIADDLEISKEAASNLSPDVELGPKAQKAFEELRKFF